MDTILLLNEIHTNRSICFWRWLPINEKDPLEVTIDSMRFRLFVNLKEMDSVFPPVEMDQIPRGNHWVNRIMVTIEVPVDDASNSIWYSMNPPVEFLSRIAKAWRVLESSFYAIVRNEIGQYWLPNSHEVEGLSDMELLTGMRIKQANGQWKQFCRGLVSLDSPIPSKDEMVDSQRWHLMSELIKKNYKPDLSLVFLRNAQKHFRLKEYRIAIVEGCIALERAILHTASLLMSEAERDSLSAVLCNDSLTDKVNSILPILMRKKGKAAFDPMYCASIVNTRNQIIHKARVRLDEADARKQIKELAIIVRILNDRIFKEITE